MPKVSIIIPVYNIQSFLPDCLESAIVQTYTDIEIICVNDGSTDSSADIIREYARKDPRIRQIDKPNGGLPAARHTGIENATGDYIFHLDGDDDIPPRTIEHLVSATENGRYDVVVGDYISTDADGNIVTVNSEINKPLDSVGYMRYILTRGLFNVWGKLMRRSLYTDNDITLPSHIHMAEDLVHVFQIAHFAKSIAPCHQICYNYYTRTTSMSRSSEIGSLTDRSIYAVEFIKRFYVEHKINSVDLEMQRYLCDFIFTYLQSPNKVSLHKTGLESILDTINISTINNIKYPLKRVALKVAKRHLATAKGIVKLAQKIRQK